MWEDDNFDTIGLGLHCLPLDFAPEEEVSRRTTRVYCDQIEDLEDKDAVLQGDLVEKQHILANIEL